MDVWLLRHAEAYETSSSGRDEDRELTADGRSRAESVARALVALSAPISAVLTSPFARARATAAPCARALRLDPPRDFPALLPGTDPAHAAAEIARSGRAPVLLVGHQPLLGALAGFLVFGDEHREIPLRKATLARIVWQPGSAGALEALLPPELLEKLVRAEN
jgi:phosphohistidine phosphatase